MAEANVNVRVNAQKARQELNLTTESVENLTVNVAIQQQKIAEANQEVVKYTRLLGNAGSGAEQMKFQSALKTANEKLADQKAGLKELNAELNAAKVQRKLNTKAVQAGTIKAAQFNETLLKNRDVSTGLSKITGGLSLQFQSFGKLFLSLGRGIKASTASLSLFKKVLISTGIGALVVLVGTLVANFDKIKESLSGVNAEQKKAAEEATKSATAAEEQLKSISDTEETLKRQGKTEKEIRDLKVQQTNETITALEAQLTAQQTIRDEQIKTAERNKKILTGILNFVLLPLEKLAEGLDKVGAFFGKDFGLADKVGGAGASIAGSIFTGIDEEGDKAIADTEKKLKQLKNRRDGFINQQKAEDDAEKEKENAKILKDIKDAIDNEVKRQEGIANIREKYKRLNQDRDDLTFQQKAERERERALLELDALNATEEQKAELIKYYQGVVSDAIIQDEQARANKIKEVEDQKRAIREKTFNTAIQLAGEESRLGKAMLVAKTILAAKENIMEVKRTLIKAQQASTEATVDGAKAGSAIASGAAETAKVGFPQNIPLIIAYAAQAIGIIAAVKSAIGKTKSVAASAGASGGGGSVGIDAPSIQTSAPSFNIVGTTPENQLAQTISAQQQKPVKAFVVAGDVTTAQGLERNIIQESSLG